MSTEGARSRVGRSHTIRGVRGVSSIRTLLALAAAAVAGAPAPATEDALGVVLLPVASGFTAPLRATHAGDGSGRIFVGQQSGEILIFDGVEVLAQPFLDLSGAVGTASEGGLLGLAFHPQFATNGRFFVHYTDSAGDSVVAGYRVDGDDSNRADPESAEVLLTQEQPFSNHNGGHLAFGPDGTLYVAFGDGGSGGDPGNRAQDLTTWHGSLLRIDVDAPDPGLAYGVPADNPFVGMPPALPEIWSYGLRNPWRFSFDRATGDLWIGDVGQGRFEEIDLQPADSPGGENWGWRILEGDTCFEPPSGCDPTGTEPPLFVYAHGAECSVTGGYRYRGVAAPRLAGIYLFADFCSGVVWGGSQACDGGWQFRQLADTEEMVSSFGEDGAGEVLLVSRLGTVFRVEPDPATVGPAVGGAPASVDLGPMPIGDQASASVVLAPLGEGPEPARVEGIEIVGDAGFTVDASPAVSPCGATPCLQPAAATCAVTVSYEAASQGEAAAQLIVEGNFPTLLVPLAAAGYGPCPHPSEVDLGGQAVPGAGSVVACRSILTGGGTTLGGAGETVLRAGEEIRLQAGTEIFDGVILELDRLLALGAP